MGSLGDTLLDIVDNSLISEVERQAKLVTWREELRSQLCLNTNDLLEHRHPLVAASIPDSFPDINIVRAYSPSPLPSPLPLSIASTVTPNIDVIVTCIAKYFEWGHLDGIVARFRSLHIWSAICIRLAYQRAIFGQGE